MITKLLLGLLVIIAKFQTPTALTFPDYVSANEHVKSMYADLKKFGDETPSGNSRFGVHGRLLTKYPEFSPEIRYMLYERVERGAKAGELNAVAVDGYRWYWDHFARYDNQEKKNK